VHLVPKVKLYLHKKANAHHKYQPFALFTAFIKYRCEKRSFIELSDISLSSWHIFCFIVGHLPHSFSYASFYCWTSPAVLLWFVLLLDISRSPCLKLVILLDISRSPSPMLRFIVGHFPQSLSWLYFWTSPQSLNYASFYCWISPAVLVLSWLYCWISPAVLLLCFVLLLDISRSPCLKLIILLDISRKPWHVFCYIVGHFMFPPSLCFILFLSFCFASGLRLVREYCT
jgi:hypothetical protein